MVRSRKGVMSRLGRIHRKSVAATCVPAIPRAIPTITVSIKSLALPKYNPAAF
ncbi:MAG: hypothetical protein QW612_04575 [Candidatus Bathyarchaeia archaeon]